MMSSFTRRKFLIESGQTILGASALGAFLAACGGTTPPTSAKTATLSYWSTGYKPKTTKGGSFLTDQAAQAFVHGHTNTKVNVVGYTPDDAGYTKLIQAIQSGGTVDVFRVAADELPLMIKQGLVAPIDDYLGADDKSDIFPSDLSAVAGKDGKHYAWPLWVPPNGMYLNLDIFQERGVTPPSDDWTYEQFVEIAQKLTFTRANGEKVYGYASLIDPGSLSTWPFIMGDGGVPFNSDNTQYTLNSAQGISGLQKLVDLARKYKVTPPDFGGALTTADIVSGFSQRKTYAMYSAPSGDSVTYKAAGLNFDVKPMPICGLGTHFTTGGVGLVAVASNSNADQLKAAMELAKYLTGPQVPQDVPGYYLAPGARVSVKAQDPISKFAPFVPYTWLAPNIPQWAQIRTLIHPQLQKAVLGQLSAADALNGPATEINALLSGS